MLANGNLKDRLGEFLDICLSFFAEFGNEDSIINPLQRMSKNFLSISTFYSLGKIRRWKTCQERHTSYKIVERQF